MTNDQTEELLAFVKTVAGFQLYGDEMPYEDHHGDDAMTTLNRMIEYARALTKR